MSLLRPGIAHVGFYCAMGHEWICAMSYNPATGTLRPLTLDAECCPTCKGEAVDPHGAPKEFEAPGKIRLEAPRG